MVRVKRKYIMEFPRYKTIISVSRKESLCTLIHRCIEDTMKAYFCLNPF